MSGSPISAFITNNFNGIPLTPYLIKMLGNISIEEKGSFVRINGVNGYTLTKLITKEYETSKISSYMFNGITSASITLHRYFLPDLLSIINTLLTSRNIIPPVKTLVGMKKVLLEETYLSNLNLEHKPRLNMKLLEQLNYPEYEGRKGLIEYQVNYLRHYSEELDKHLLRGCLLNSAPGTGKAQPLFSNILTPNGWTTMGEVNINDTVICKNGKHSKVLETHPQGITDYYQVTFEDGRTVDVNNEHLWEIYCYDILTNAVVIKKQIVETHEMAQLLNISNLKVYVELANHEIKHDIELPLNPYYVGVYLGNGHEDIKEFLAISELEFNDINIDSVTQIEKDLNERRIPYIYFTASLNQKLELLRGLLDVQSLSHPYLKIRSTQLDLLKDCQRVLWSIGGKGSVDIEGQHYVLNLIYKKLEDITPDFLKIQRSVMDGFIQVTNVVYKGQTETKCILIDDEEHLYITDNYIPTHNTITSLSVGQALEAEKRIVFCDLPQVELVWGKTIRSLHNTTDVYIGDKNVSYQDQQFSIFNYEKLDLALELGNRSYKKHKTIVILDECHNLNDTKSKRTQLFMLFCKLINCDNVIFQSGTPVKALGNELIPLLRTINPFFDDHVEARFRKIFGSEAKKTLSLLKARLDTAQFVIPKTVLNLDKPTIYTIKLKVPNGKEFTLDVIKVEMMEFIKERTKYYQQRKDEDHADYQRILDIFEAYHIKTDKDRKDFYEYKRCVKVIQTAYRNLDLKNAKDELEYAGKYELKVIVPTIDKIDADRFKEVRTIVKYVGLKIQGECLGRVLGKKRIECTRALVPNLNIKEIIDSTLKKVLIYTSYVEVVEDLISKLEGEGYQPLSVYGKHTSNLTSIVNEFDRNPSLNPLIATFKSLSTGVPLIMADRVVFMNTPFRDYIINQTISRVDRLGADSAIWVYNVLLDTGDEVNISSRSLNIMAWAKEQVELITGIKSDYDLVNTETLALEDFYTVTEKLDLDNDYNVLSEYLKLELNMTKNLLPHSVSKNNLSKW